MRQTIGDSRQLYLKPLSLIAGLWKYDKAKMELTNKDEITLKGKWRIPEAGRENVSFIESEDGKMVLSIEDQAVKVDGQDTDAFKVILMLKPTTGERKYTNEHFQKWERSLDHEEYFVLANQHDPHRYFLLANKEKAMSVGEELPKSTPKPTKSTTTITEKPTTAGADSKTIKISAIFIQLILLAELLMM